MRAAESDFVARRNRCGMFGAGTIASAFALAIARPGL